MSGTSAPDSSSLKCGCSASRSSRSRAADERRRAALRRATVRAAAWVLLTAVVAVVARVVVVFLVVVRLVAAKDGVGSQNPTIIDATQTSRRHEDNRAWITGNPF